jgi:hypothetical protein
VRIPHCGQFGEFPLRPQFVIERIQNEPVNAACRIGSQLSEEDFVVNAVQIYAHEIERTSKLASDRDHLLKVPRGNGFHRR